MCVGFNCLKNALISLNILYVVVGIVLIYASVSGKLASPYSDNLPVATGIEICGTFLIGLALLGLLGAVKHHQVILFFYMIILFILFITQLIVSYASMTVSDDQLKKIALKSWTSMDTVNKNQFMEDFHCCNFDDEIPAEFLDNDPICFNVPCCNGQVGSQCNCPKCAEKLISTVGYVFKLAGQLGMFFSFTEIFGVWLTKRYRNQKDPRAHPSAFL